MSVNIVLFVDDEINILKTIERAVMNESYMSLYANSGQEALELMAQYKITVLVTDMRMPGVDGLAILKVAKDKYPDTIRMVLSGYTDVAQMLEAINSGAIFRYITKPWHMEEDLLSVIRHAIAYYNLLHEKREQEKSIHQRNVSYQKMLRNMEEKFSSNRRDLSDIKTFFSSALDIFINELGRSLKKKSQASLGKEILQIQILKEITDNYIDNLPTMMQEFSLADILSLIKSYANDQMGKLKIRTIDSDAPHEKTYFGNFKMLSLIMNTLFTLLSRAGTQRSFVCRTTIEDYRDLAQISCIIEIGHVDDVNILINEYEILTGDSFSFYSEILSQLGKPSNIHVTFTYINPNASIITVTSDVLTSNK